VEFALHGYNHRRETDFYGASEFGGVPYDVQRERLVRGRAVLKRCIGSAPRTFVPPFNTYDANTSRAATAAGFRTVSGGGWFTRAHYNLSGPFSTGRMDHLPSSSEMIANWSTHEHYSTAVLEARFDRAYANGSVFVQVLHYQTFRSEAHREQLRELIRHMKRRDVLFVTVGEFEEARREGRLEQTDDGWRYRPESGGAGGVFWARAPAAAVRGTRP
jgi:peptidoglycan/xylan/chitin deacetylase (PgdA/CDA1 family)